MVKGVKKEKVEYVPCPVNLRQLKGIRWDGRRQVYIVRTTLMPTTCGYKDFAVAVRTFKKFGGNAAVSENAFRRSRTKRHNRSGKLRPVHGTDAPNKAEPATYPKPPRVRPAGRRTPKPNPKFEEEEPPRPAPRPAPRPPAPAPEPPPAAASGPKPPPVPAPPPKPRPTMPPKRLDDWLLCKEPPVATIEEVTFTTVPSHVLARRRAKLRALCAPPILSGIVAERMCVASCSRFGSHGKARCMSLRMTTTRERRLPKRVVDVYSRFSSESVRSDYFEQWPDDAAEKRKAPNFICFAPCPKSLYYNRKRKENPHARLGKECPQRGVPRNSSATLARVVLSPPPLECSEQMAAEHVVDEAQLLQTDIETFFKATKPRRSSASGTTKSAGKKSVVAVPAPFFVEEEGMEVCFDPFDDCPWENDLAPLGEPMELLDEGLLAELDGW